MNKTLLRILAFAYAAAVVGYILYGWINYAGLYRWFAEWQLAQFGAYELKLTFVIPMFVLFLPGAIVFERLGLRLGVTRRVWTRDPNAPQRQSGSTLRYAALLGFALLAVALGAFWLGERKLSEPVTVEAVNLTANQAPQSAHVRLTAIAHPGLITKFETKSYGVTYTYTYVPMTSADWRRGDPLIYFVKTNINAYIPPQGGATVLLDRKTPPFEMTSKGVLVADDLPGPITELYRKSGVVLGPQVFVLNAIDTRADLSAYWIMASVAGLLGFCTLVMIPAIAVRQRRLKRT
jgi:hypothetical protein